MTNGHRTQDGRLPSARWRQAGLAIALVMAAAVVTQLQAGTVVSGGLTDVFDNTGPATPTRPGSSPGTAGSPASSPSSWCSAPRWRC